MQDIVLPVPVLYALLTLADLVAVFLLFHLIKLKQVGIHRFAIGTAVCTVFLLLAGALVTSTGSSLAVPDWPLSFGKIFPNMTGGVFYEHGHRMVVGVVSVLVQALVLSIQVREKRAWVRRLAWGSLFALLLQAVLGGITVLWKLPPQVSVAHAGLAQIFFCLAVSLALATSRSWVEGKPVPPEGGPSGKALLSVTLLIYLQIVVGAVTRHLGGGLAIPDFHQAFGGLLPFDWTHLSLLNFLHTRVGAGLVLAGVTWAAFGTCLHHPSDRPLFLPAALAGFLVWIQVFLGFSILLTRKAVLLTSVHLVVGAGLLASMVVLTLNRVRAERIAGR